uniref:Uncharacterized protein n=1 Tax=Nyctotherus ovalis TaxID=70075 RepID=A6MI45_NYCOV|nr:hypothetical protein [Nyctotherus ovalis]ABR27270.1 hypothetical protein [Nyctotherus ovalis]
MENYEEIANSTTYSLNGEISNSPSAGAPPMVQDTEAPLRARINFRQGSKVRRNVNKCIIRFIFKYYDREELKEQYERHGLRLESSMIHVIETTKANERRREGDERTASGPKDYKKLLRMLLCYKTMRLLVKCCLERLISHLKRRETKGIKEGNKKVYVDTVEDYINYINNVDSTIAHP